MALGVGLALSGVECADLSLIVSDVAEFALIVSDVQVCR